MTRPALEIAAGQVSASRHGAAPLGMVICGPGHGGVMSPDGTLRDRQLITRTKHRARLISYQFLRIRCLQITETLLVHFYRSANVDKIKPFNFILDSFQ